MNLRESILKVLREEFKPSLILRRRANFAEIDKAVKKGMISNFKKNENIEKNIDSTIDRVVDEVMLNYFFERLSELEYTEIRREYESFIRQKYSDYLRQYFEKRQKTVDQENNEMGYGYIFVKHDHPYYEKWRGFSEGFDSFDDMITKYGNWVDVDWDEVKQKLDNIKDFPENKFTGRYDSRPLRISSIGDEGNTWGYNFSVIKSIPEENIEKLKKNINN